MKDYMSRLMSQFAQEAEYLHAASQGTLEEIQQWVADGVDVHVTDKKGRNALYLSALNNGARPEVFRYLLGLGLRRDVIVSDNDPLIELVVACDLAEHLDALVASGESVNVVAPVTCRTLLMRAAMSDHGPDMVVRLLGYGARVDARDFEGNTALHLAASPAIANALLDAGAAIDAVNVSGQKTPLMLALSVSPVDTFYNGEREVARALIARGADVEAASDGLPILHQMASRGEVDAVKMLLDAGASTETRDYLGQTAIFAAMNRTLSGQPEGDRPGVMRLLIDRGADIEAQHDGSRPLQVAAGFGDAEIFAVLLAAGADPTAVTADGRTLENIIAHVELEKAKQLRLLLATHLARKTMQCAADMVRARSPA